MPKVHSTILPKNLLAEIRHDRPHIQVSPVVIESAGLDVAALYQRYTTRSEGLITADAQARLAEHGPNVLAKDRQAGVGTLLWHAVLNPLVILLTVLATVSFVTGDSGRGA